MIKPFALLALAAATITTTTSAQVLMGIFGHQVTGQHGTAGEFCWAFSCTPHQLPVVAGETLTMRVNAPLQAGYAIGLSFSATMCLSFPGVGNQLVLDPPIETLALGLVLQPSPWLACWGGYQDVTLALPPGLPPGFSFSTQALAAVPNFTSGAPVSLSSAVTMTVL